MQNPQPFIDETFSKRECVRYIPVSKKSDKCGCGLKYRQHTHLTSANGRSSTSIEVQREIASHRSWSIAKDSQKFPTDSYGVIEFQGGAYVRKAQFLRLDFDTPPARIVELFERCWNLERPRLVVSVHGGLQNFDLQPKLERAFTKGLLKAAKTTGTWIITSGLNCGAVHHVASTLNEAGGSVRSRRRLVSIGIAPWGLLKNREDFTGRGSVVQYNSKFATTTDGHAITLNEMHTHFLLVDNCTVGRYGADVILRKRLEKFIAQQEIGDEGGQGGAADHDEHGGRYNRNRVPVVGLILEGGVLAIKTVLEYVNNNPPMPVIVCDGSGRAADLLAFAHKYGDPDMHFPENVKEAVMSLIRLTFSYDGDKTYDVYKELVQCLRMKHLITVFRLGEDSRVDIDHDILAAWLHGQDVTSLDRLTLTLSWNRPDIAASEVFVPGQSWTRSELEAAMMEALLCDRVEFVKLLLEQGVSMERFLTFRRLEKLYNTRKGPPHTLLWVIKDVVANVHSGYRIRLKDVGLVIEKLVGGDYVSAYRTKTFAEHYERASKSRWNTFASFVHEVRDTQQQQPEKENAFRYPFNDLFLWAVLTKRHSMAVCMWERGDEGLAKALMAAKLFDALADEAADDYLEAEICHDFRNYSIEFKQLALQLLEQCYQTDKMLALQLLTYELTNWGRRTCLSLAYAARHMEFLAHPCSQVLLADLWHGGMRIRKRSNLRVLIGLIMPPMLFTLEFKTRDELLLQPQTEDERQDVIGFRAANPNRPSHQHHGLQTDSSSSSSASESEATTAGLLPRRRRDTVFMRSRILRRISRMNKQASQEEEEDVEASAAPGKTYGAIEKQESSASLFNRTGSRMELVKRSPKKSKAPKRHQLPYGKRVKEFYQAPITTFWSWTISYLVFLGVFTYAVLLRTQPHYPTAAEGYVIAFISTYALEMIRRLCICDAKTFPQKLVVFFASDMWHLSSGVAIVMFFVALGLRFDLRTLPEARILYACVLVFWYVRLLDIMSVNNKLGPYITMIAKMIVSMMYIVTILLVTLVAYGVFHQSILHTHEDEWQWEFLKNVTYKPYFMWYGEVYASEIDSHCDEKDCATGHWLSPIAITIYLLVTNILLINLLIATFNNIFIEVNAVSQILWQFNRYAQVMEYEQKPWLPPPFTVIYYIYRIMKFTCFRRCIGGRRPKFDFRLKLFLQPDDIEKLLDFEEECIEDLQRKKNEDAQSAVKVRIQEATDRTAFISMKLDDVLAKQATHQSIIQTLDKNMRTIKEYMSVSADLAVSSGASSPAVGSLSAQKPSSTPQLPANMDEYYRLQRGMSLDDAEDQEEPKLAPTISDSPKRNSGIEFERTFSSPWGQISPAVGRMDRTMSTTSRGSSNKRKESVFHGNFEYSTITDGIDVGDCVPPKETPSNRRRRKSAVGGGPLTRSEVVFHTLTPVASFCDETGQNEAEGEQSRKPEGNEDEAASMLQKLEEQALAVSDSVFE